MTEIPEQDRSRTLVAFLRTIALFLYRIPRRLMTGLVRGYQLIISPHLPSSCRFTPTCSNYSLYAFRKYGAMKGTVLSVWRILRCHPFSRGGYDPPRWFGEKPPPEPVETSHSMNSDQVQI